MATTEVSILINPVAKVTKIVGLSPEGATTGGSFDSSWLSERTQRMKLAGIEAQLAALERIHKRVAFEIGELKKISEELAKVAVSLGPEDPADADGDAEAEEGAKNTESE